MHNIITRINNEFNDKITDIKTDNPHDKLVMSGSKAEWREVLAIYAVAYNMTDMHPANPDEVQVVTLDESKEEYIRNLFWEINKIDHRIETYTETEQVEEKQKDGKIKKDNKQVQKKALYITVSHVDLETIMTNKGFTAEQKKMCRQLLSDENNDLWRELLHGVTGSNSDIVLIAQEQLGNVGGKPYWSWYGFSSRVEWCCCFVSWCANECGYIESGTIPMYSVVDTGVDWFKSKDQWLDGSEEPEAGMIIFFDWASDGLDGSGDHTGIVEKVKGGTVYTIEGNSGDKVCENQYSIGNKEILGYGYYSGNNTVATGDVAQYFSWGNSSIPSPSFCNKAVIKQSNQLIKVTTEKIFIGCFVIKDFRIINREPVIGIMFLDDDFKIIFKEYEISRQNLLPAYFILFTIEK